jgi:hypothetical protein
MIYIYKEPHLCVCTLLKNSIIIFNQNTKMSDQFKSSKIQLWQFLLEILTEKEHRSIIRWNNDDGEFEFLEPGKNKMIK